MIELNKYSAILAVLFGGVSAILAALPVSEEWKPVLVAASGLLTALVALLHTHGPEEKPQTTDPAGQP